MRERSAPPSSPSSRRVPTISHRRWVAICARYSRRSRLEGWRSCKSPRTRRTGWTRARSVNSHDRGSEVELIGRAVCQRLDLGGDPERGHEAHERREALRQVAALRVRTARYVTLERDRKWAVGEMVGMCPAAARKDGGPAA